MTTLQPRPTALGFTATAEIQEPHIQRGLIDVKLLRQAVVHRVTECRRELRISNDPIGGCRQLGVFFDDYRANGGDE